MPTEFLNPIEVLNELKLQKNMIAADFGCGSGGWAIPLAKILSDGKVYAIDILEEPLLALRAKLKREELFNVEVRKADLEKNSNLLPNVCHLVLMTNLLFECRDKKRVLEEGKRVLKPEGRILIVDWIKDNPLTPEIEYVDFDEIKKIAKELDLKIEKEFKAGDYHFALILNN